MKPFSIEGKLALLLMIVLTCSALLGAIVRPWLSSAALAAAVVALIALVPVICLSRYALGPIRRLLRALKGAVASYRNGDFSLSLIVERSDELGAIVAAHNDLAKALRDQRQHVVQRELLLDTVMQNSPVALLLVDPAQYISYSNQAARHLLNGGRKLSGTGFQTLLQGMPTSLRESFASGKDGLVPVQMDETEETYHVAQRTVLLQGRPHRLLLLKCLTRELSRQEVAVWKKLIRILSHELNNSLAPISSMAHTGAEMVRRGQRDSLPEIFAAISERASHLHTFIDSYASFARLPVPCRQEVPWDKFVGQLRLHCEFRSSDPLPRQPGWFDPVQMAQALINLIKNAHESEGSPSEIELRIEDFGNTIAIEVLDRGSGFSEAVLANALLPFYSTKRTGTGLGLPLAREIVEAHGGNFAISNRDGAGSRVRLIIPQAHR